MKKIIYLKQEVKLGEVITYQGLEVEVTQTLIDNNPDTFKVIDEREKTLEDYENILFEERGNSVIFSSRGTYFSMYGWLKDNEPKLYYTKILQLIADDLNDGWVADSCNQQQYKYYLSIHYKKYTIERCVVYISQGAVLFNSIKLVEKAIDILGEKIEYLFN